MKLHANDGKSDKMGKGKSNGTNKYSKQNGSKPGSIFGDQSQWSKATENSTKTDNKIKKTKGGKCNLIDEESIKQAIRASELASKEAEEKAKAKEKELDQIKEMFGGLIEPDIIADYWSAFNGDTEKLITALSDMVAEIEEIKKKDEEKKAEELRIEEEKKERLKRDPENGRLKLKAKAKPFVPGKQKVEAKNEIIEEEKKVSVLPETKFESESEQNKDKEAANTIESLRTDNPFRNAFHDLEYIEPNEEEVKASLEIANKYMKEQEEEEREWFIKQEEDLLRQLINDYKVEEFIGGDLDEETIKSIYNGDNQASEVSTKDDSFIFVEDKPFENCDEEVRPFVEDPTLQILIQYQIQAEQAKLAESDYHYDRKEFPSLVNTEDLKAINRK